MGVNITRHPIYQRNQSLASIDLSRPDLSNELDLIEIEKKLVISYLGRKVKQK